MKLPALCKYYSNQMDKLIVFVKSSYQRDLWLASLVIVYQVRFVIQPRQQPQSLIIKNGKVLNQSTEK